MVAGFNTGPLSKKIMRHEFFLSADLIKTRSFYSYLSDNQHVPHITITFNISVFVMNYIKQLQADKAEALDSARSIEAAINHLISYLSCPKFHVDTRVQVGDVLRDLPPIHNDVAHMAVSPSNVGTNDNNI